MSNWINVNDRLPPPYINFGGTEFSDDVLVLLASGKMFIDYVIYPHGVYGADTTPRFNVNYDKKVKDIRYWQHLPKPPNCEKDSKHI